MAPARKKQRKRVTESEQTAADSHEKESLRSIPPVSILKDSLANLPNVKSLPKTDEMDQLNLRRKTYFIHGADQLEENEPSVIHNTQETLTLNTNEKIRRLTYVVRSNLNEESDPLVNGSPGIKMTYSELEIKGMQENESLISQVDPGNKPTKRGQKKKKSANNSKALNKKTVESDNDLEENNQHELAPTVTVKAKKKKESGDVAHTTVLIDVKVKRGRKKKNEISVPTIQNISESIEDEGDVSTEKDNESLVPGSKTLTKRGSKKTSASNHKGPVESMEMENDFEDFQHDLASMVTVKTGKKKLQKTQGEENKTDPTQSGLQKKSIKRRRKKNDQ